MAGDCVSCGAPIEAERCAYCGRIVGGAVGATRLPAALVAGRIDASALAMALDVATAAAVAAGAPPTVVDRMIARSVGRVERRR